MVLNTRLEHAPGRVGDVSHLLCTHLVESDATGLLNTISLMMIQLIHWLDPLRLIFN